MPPKSKKNTKKKAPKKKGNKKPVEDTVETAENVPEISVEEIPIFTDEIDELNYELHKVWCSIQKKIWYMIKI